MKLSKLIIFSSVFSSLAVTSHGYEGEELNEVQVVDLDVNLMPEQTACQNIDTAQHSNWNWSSDNSVAGLDPKGGSANLDELDALLTKYNGESMAKYSALVKELEKANKDWSKVNKDVMGNAILPLEKLIKVLETHKQTYENSIKKNEERIKKLNIIIGTIGSYKDDDCWTPEERKKHEDAYQNAKNERDQLKAVVDKDKKFLDSVEKKLKEMNDLHDAAQKEWLSRIAQQLDESKNVIDAITGMEKVKKNTTQSK